MFLVLQMQSTTVGLLVAMSGTHIQDTECWITVAVINQGADCHQKLTHMARGGPHHVHVVDHHMRSIHVEGAIIPRLVLQMGRWDGFSE